MMAGKRLASPVRNAAARALLAVAAFALGYGMMQPPILRGQPGKKQGNITLSQSAFYTLEDLASRIRAESEIEGYVDKRRCKDKVFVSKGVYPAADLMEAIGTAAGLEVRRVGPIHFLAPPDTSLGRTLNFPLLRDENLQGVFLSLRPMAERVDLKKEGIPWKVNDFLSGKEELFEKLSDEQRKFVIATFESHDWYVPGRKEGEKLESYPKSLRGKRVHLGTSFLMAGFVFDPTTRDAAGRDVGGAATVIQVYYDYGDRLKRFVESRRQSK